MSLKFIELHARYSKSPVIINTEQICYAKAMHDSDGEYTELFISGNVREASVMEKYDEVNALIAVAGYFNDKADPRLDGHMLTMDDMTKPSMIGEPVWCSVQRRWMLLIDNAADRSWVELINDAGGHEKMIAHDVQRNAFYRMKRR